MVPTVPIVPLPRRPLDSSDPVLRWYENELGWAAVPGPPVRLVTGLRFDVLEVPAEAGRAALRHLGPASPVTLQGNRMRVLVAAGSADELPGLLDWLEWGALALDLTAIGAGGSIEAPPPPGTAGAPHPSGMPALPAAPENSQGAAVWLRPPEFGREVEPSLPTLSAVGGGGGAPDLVRLVDTMATHCHRVRLRRTCAQPLAFS
ncbi:SCO3374 family protein [Streptomyces albiflavescens]|uniref:SCO3374 family protein n=1 Tax=Streptomyces albiflavescens TaxID=1623582 RepID=UPI00166B004B|nr:SCO3374 family protein [Streptomyces albiflavescens]